MTQNVRDIIGRQEVSRVLPRVPIWSRLLTWAVFCGLAWVLVLLFIGGIWWWADQIAMWAR